ncbi:MULTISPECIES: amidohydrolase family protein [unclassified Haladaptatus]|uniref:amidohydrolase family protein n=1 Tax=unclassified Haladaptatus TaxID=2622732 RepID=UPI00209BC867|nr:MULTISPECIES: amidohydrolase family protein [unclassified Haladaptatus]MCO8244911.1 amidohydrolase [Haladaptatus sp. AB643]MCO8255576.1 amidohydrolase [Haladaptatus sp. AB618]
MIDTHTHAWGYPSPERPWSNGPIIDLVDGFDVHTAFTSERLLADMDTVGVDEAVVVGYPICDWTDNSYTVDCVAQSERLYGVVMVDPFADGAADTLRNAMDTERVLGFRLGAACPYDAMWESFDASVTWLRDAIEETEFWNAARETGAIVQILADETQLDQAIELVETYPELPYLFDHFAHTDPSVPPRESAFSQFSELAEHESVAVKVSEIVHRSEEGFPYADVHDHVRWMLDEFGRERVIWGSDYPNVSDEATYDEAVSWVEHVEGLSDTDREWLTERAFRRHVDP